MTSRVLQRPSTDNIPPLLKADVMPPVRSSWIPEQVADMQASSRMQARIMLIAVKEEEQAVSTLKQGPCMPYTYAMRPHATLRACPVSRYAGEPTSCMPRSPENSMLAIPTPTAQSWPRSLSSSTPSARYAATCNTWCVLTKSMRCIGSMDNVSW